MKHPRSRIRPILALLLAAFLTGCSARAGSSAAPGSSTPASSMQPASSAAPASSVSPASSAAPAKELHLTLESARLGHRSVIDYAGYIDENGKIVLSDSLKPDAPPEIQALEGMDAIGFWSINGAYFVLRPDATMRVFFSADGYYAWWESTESKANVDAHKQKVADFYADLDQKLRQMHIADMRTTGFYDAQEFVMFRTTDGEVYTYDLSFLGETAFQWIRLADRGAVAITGNAVLFDNGEIARFRFHGASNLDYLDGVRWPDVVDIAVQSDFAIGLRADGSIRTYRIEGSDMYHFANTDVRAQAIYDSNGFVVRTADDRLIELLLPDGIDPQPPVQCPADAVAISLVASVGPVALLPDGTLQPVESGINSMENWTSKFGDGVIRTKMPIQ